MIISKDLAILLHPDKAAAMITKPLFSSRDIFLPRENTVVSTCVAGSALA